MKLLVVNKLLIERGWQVIDKTTETVLLSPSRDLCAERLVVLPVQSNTLVPTGTLEAILRRIGQQKTVQPWCEALSARHPFELIIEQTPEASWGRLEINGLMLVVRAVNPDELKIQIKQLLSFLTASLETDYCQVIKSMRLELYYDMTEMWALFRQVRVSCIADMTGIDATQVSQFMNGKTYPSVKQTKQLKQSIQDLCTQLLQLTN